MTALQRLPVPRQLRVAWHSGRRQTFILLHSLLSISTQQNLCLCFGIVGGVAALHYRQGLKPFHQMLNLLLQLIVAGCTIAVASCVSLAQL